MWNLENQCVTVLLSVLTGCTILHIFGESLIALIIVLITVIYVFLVKFNGYLRTLQTYFEPDNIQQTDRNFYQFIQSNYIKKKNYLINYFRERGIFKRKMYRRKQYQLSSDTSSPNNNFKQNSLVGLSPIIKNSRHSLTSRSENNLYPINSRFRDGIKFDKITSTPLIGLEARQCRNGGIHNVASKSQEFSPRRSAISDHESSREDSLRSQSSAWGTSISPRMRSRAGGIKTVQTVAGPLLASTRYNIDPKVLSDVNSPGFSSRLAKYADEASTKLAHQSQYAAGQFPLVNLNATPPPLVQANRVRTPVLVRIAPPELTKYSPPEKGFVSLSEMCLAKEAKAAKGKKAAKEISLKRRASSYDVDLIKKQRTDEVQEEVEVTQKRGREEESPKTKDISSDSQLSRPAKRTKTPSSYGIINSLSSSVHVTSGVKRKADPLQSETPVSGKHLKILEESTPPPRIINIACSCGRTFNTSGEISEEKPETPLETMLESSPVISPKEPQSPVSIVNESPKTEAPPPQKLSERLFMTNLPVKTKKRVLEDEKESPKFLGEEENDEITKAAVIEMREFHKLKFKVLFLGKNNQESNEAETTVVTSVEKTSGVNTLPNSTSLICATSTTDINVTPIVTTAPVPIMKTSKTTVSPTKHVTFQLPASRASSIDTDAQSTTSSSQTAEGAPGPAPVMSFPAAVTSTPPTWSFGVPTVTTVSLMTPASTAAVVNTTTTAPTLASTAAPVNFAFNAPTTASPASTASTVLTPASTPQWSTPLPTSSSANIFGPSSSQVTTQVTTAQSNSITTVPTFPSSVTTESAVSKSGFNFSTTFSSSAATKPASEAAAPVFNFKADNTSTTATTSTTSTPSLFNFSGGSATAKTFSFNAPSTTQATDTSSAFKTTPAFGSTSTPAIAAFGSAPASSTSLFSFGAPTTTQASMFPSNTTTTSSLTRFSASKPAETIATSVNNTTPVTSAPLFAAGGLFGQTKPSMFSTTTSTFTANPQAATSGFATSAGLFGTQPTPSATFGSTAMSSSTSTFGSTTATPAFGAISSTAPVFGASNAAVPTFGASTSTFSSMGTNSVAPATTTTGFGVPTTAPPSFAAATALPSFGSITTTPVFGATAAPSAFSTSSSATPSFGSTSSSFGSTNAFGTPNTAPPAFGAASSAFGSTALPAPPVFGSQPTSTPAFGASSTSVPAFGATPSASTSAFSFGASTSQPQQPPSMFSFGEANAAASMPFSVPKPTPNSELVGINFSGASSAPAAFPGAPATPGGMFSIGSGSTSRTRGTRSRRQR